MPDRTSASTPKALVIAAVEPDSPAARAGLLPGDILREVGGRPILDILDYRFRSAAPRFGVRVERNGEDRTVNLRVPEGEGAGLEFTEDLADGVHTCVNRCVFCFVHQMPAGMRRSLYLKDDDFRLSFIHGNYVTLTNMREGEWQRILEQRLSPLYVSVHATDPEMRGNLLGRKMPAPILPQLRQLAEGRVDTHVQIVLCPGLNDGAALERTLADLSALHPSATGLRSGVLSVAIVPVGLTRFRERLPHLTPASADYARAMIGTVRRAALRFRRTIGTRFVWLSDEWYWLAGAAAPGIGHYEDFPQLDDGVGTTRLFLDDLRRLSRRLPAASQRPVRAALITAELPSRAVLLMADTLNRVDGVDLRLRVVRNRFFGGGINIAGLLTATDIAEDLRHGVADGAVYVPGICLRDRQVFLDDVSLEELRARTGADIRIAERTPTAFAESLGLVPHRRSRSAR